MNNHFTEWSVLKQKLNQKEDQLFFHEKEIWWTSIGLNIGSEVFGKGSSFLRPVIIFKKLSQSSFLGIPLTTKTKIGSWYYTFLYHEKSTCANIAQIRVFDIRRLMYKQGELKEEHYIKIKLLLKNLFNL